MISTRNVPVILWFTFSIILFSLSCAAQKTNISNAYNVKDFGAVGDGKTDDSRSIQNCLNQVAKTGGTVIFPQGNYKTTIGLSISINSKIANRIKIQGNSSTIINNTAPKEIFQVISNTGGTLTLDGLSIDGKITRDERNQKLNGPKFTIAFLLQGFDSTLVSNITIQNIYGTGLFVSTTSHRDASLLKSKEYCHIYNNKVLNCSGLNGGSRTDDNGKKIGYDNYGDGIIYVGGRTGLIENNTVENDLNTVGAIGRGGIAIVRFNMNIKIQNNTVKGYDRGVHVEATYGGHNILNNTISNCNTSILCSGTTCDFIQNNPTIIEGNTITDGIYDRNKHGGIMNPYAFIRFMRSTDLMKNSRVQNNNIKMIQKRPRLTYFLVSGQSDMYIDNNDFISSNPGTGAILLHQHTYSFSNNEIVNLYNVQARNSVDQVVGNTVVGSLNSDLLGR